MPWSNWIDVPFNSNGTLNRVPLTALPQRPGVYAVASKQRNGLYVTHYVGRSKNIQERLHRHLTGHGNKVIASQLLLKKTITLAPASICVAFLETSDPKIVEALYIDTHDLPICNLIRARLPIGLSEALVQKAD